MILFETMTNKDNINHLTCVMIYIYTLHITVVLKQVNEANCSEGASISIFLGRHILIIVII